MTLFQSKHFKNISLITLGSTVTWYEFFLYIFWVPQINKVFLFSKLTSLDAFLIFSFGYLLRPLSGLIFGRIGDTLGRKPALVISILMATLPSIIIAFLPSFNNWGVFAFSILQAIRMLQSIPSGSEEPGSMCYLYEIAPPKKTYFSSSFSFLGSQMGSILGISSCLLMQALFSEENMITWGWRLSFLISAILGLVGFKIRHKLSETHPFEHLKKEKKILKSPVIHFFTRYRKAMIVAFSISIFEVVGFFIATIFPSFYYPIYFNITPFQNFIINIFLLSLSSISLPFFGKLGDKFGAKTPLLFSSILSAALSIMTYKCLKAGVFIPTLSTQALLCVSISCMFALIPATLCHLFPTHVRYTAVGFSFNFAASVLGGISPIFAYFYSEIKTDPASFIGLFVLVCTLGLWLFTGARSKSIFENRHELFFRCTQHKKIN